MKKCPEVQLPDRVWTAVICTTSKSDSSLLPQRPGPLGSLTETFRCGAADSFLEMLEENSRTQGIKSVCFFRDQLVGRPSSWSPVESRNTWNQSRVTKRLCGRRPGVETIRGRGTFQQPKIQGEESPWRSPNHDSQW